MHPEKKTGRMLTYTANQFSAYIKDLTRFSSFFLPKPYMVKKDVCWNRQENFGVSAQYQRVSIPVGMGIWAPA